MRASRYSRPVSKPDAPLLTPPDDVAAEVDVDSELLRRLLASQHPDLGAEPIEAFAEGWDNVLFRVGERLVARLPRRAMAARLVAGEARWLPVLAKHLPLAVPVPERVGSPGEGYPFPWTLVGWLDGAPAAGAKIDPDRAARDLGGFLEALHGLAAPEDAPTSEVRGVSPSARSEFLLPRLRSERVRSQIDAARVERLWSQLVRAPDWAGRRVFCHGDLHPFNMLARDGRLVAVIDWGDLHAREPAPDLAAAWMLLPRDAHPCFRAAYGEIDAATWLRAQAWALYFGVMFVDAGATGAGEAATRIGRATLDRLLA